MRQRAGVALWVLAVALLAAPVATGEETGSTSGTSSGSANASKEDSKDRKTGFWNRMRHRKPKETAETAAPGPSEEPAPAPTKVKKSKNAASREADEARAARELEAEVQDAADLDRLIPIADRLAEGPAGRDPVARDYLGLVRKGKANAAQLNDFASYLARRGLLDDALEFQRTAIVLAPDHPTLWTNLGSIQNGLARHAAAKAAFRKAIDLDPGNAFAHYNLGAIYDADRDYDDAIDEYKIALSLDPSLADPRKNPQVVNNERLLAVTLLLYQEKAGSLGLPFIPMQSTAPAGGDRR